MKIGCLQFAPQVGDIDNNLNRADAVLSRAKTEDLDELDLLVLPELAFTGYNFPSLQAITPFLEPSGSGISSLWARTTALRYNCTVCVGYPEKVDVAAKWPTSPEYYNSAILVNGDGETIANYRKQFLFSTDETWALEGKDGFYEGHLPGLGNTSMGICMDLNPYKFEAPWHAFEFAFHVLEMESNLVILTMSWLTREEGRLFSRMPQEPDIETLTYWVSRLEPVIRAEKDDEIIVVLCNRTGAEGETYYAGTSAVLGIKDGEVRLYGVLGRGSKELLYVDTDEKPYAKMIYRPDGQLQVPASPTQQLSPLSSTQSVDGSQTSSYAVRTSVPAAPPSEAGSRKSDSQTLAGSEFKAVLSILPTTTLKECKERPSPKLKIPPPLVAHHGYGRSDSVPPTIIDESPIIPTPTAPSPTPLAIRPKLIIPNDVRPIKDRKATLYPHDEVPILDQFAEQPIQQPSQTTVFAGQFTPSTSTDVHNSVASFAPWRSSQPTPEDSFDQLLSRIVAESPLLTAVRTNMVPSQVRPQDSYSRAGRRSEHEVVPSPRASRQTSTSRQENRRVRDKLQKSSEDEPYERRARSSGSLGRVKRQQLASRSPKARSASRTRAHQRRPSEPQANFQAIGERLAALQRPASAMDSHRSRAQDIGLDRPKSPKSRNSSRSRPWDASELGHSERVMDLARVASIPIAASPSIFGKPGPRRRQDSMSTIMRSETENNSCPSRMQSRDCSQCRPESRPRCTSSSSETWPLNSIRSRSRSDSVTGGKAFPDMHDRRPASRAMSRGRTRGEKQAVSVRSESFGAPEPRASSRMSEIFRSTSRPATQDDEIIAIVEFSASGCAKHGLGAFPDTVSSDDIIPDVSNSPRHSPDPAHTPPVGFEAEKPNIPSEASDSDARSPAEVASDPCLTSAGSSLATLETLQDLASYALFIPSTPQSDAVSTHTPKKGSGTANRPYLAASPPGSGHHLPSLKTDFAIHVSEIDRPRSAVW